MTRRSVLLVHHAARRQHQYPDNSVAALRACLDAGARAVEVDIAPLPGGDFALEHNARPEGEDAAPPDLLSQALELIRRHPCPIELQLDLKRHRPLTDQAMSSLATMLQPVKDRILVSSTADWALRRLRALDGTLSLGFDPMLYLDVDAGEKRDTGWFPRGLVKEYDYLDDHPWIIQRWGDAADYVAARAEAPEVQAPGMQIWYIAARLLNRALHDGFDWIDHLHRQGVQVATWTLNAGKPDEVSLAQWLVARGVNRIMTNDAPALGQVLGADAVY